MTSVLDIKMVQVSNGSVLWSYRHEEDMRSAEATGLVSVELKAFASAMAQQQEVTLRTLRQVTELCRQQQSRIERLSEEMKSMTSRMRTQSNRM